MTRLVSVYLDSCHHDEGEGLPKIPGQPHGDTVGQLVEIEVADIFCMSQILSHSITDLFYQFDGPRHFQSCLVLYTRMRRYCNTDILAVLRYNLHWRSPSGLLRHISNLIGHVPVLVLKPSVECCAICIMYVNDSQISDDVFTNSGTLQHISRRSIFHGFRCLSGDMSTS
jgi:hypothetical protein